jgi:hypothetical protein
MNCIDDNVSGELLISTNNLRSVLGKHCRIPYCYQTRFISELCHENIIIKVSNNIYKVNKE